MEPVPENKLSGVVKGFVVNYPSKHHQVKRGAKTIATTVLLTVRIIWFVV
jgi:hypothetical protein